VATTKITPTNLLAGRHVKWKLALLGISDRTSSFRSLTYWSDSLAVAMAREQTKKMGMLLGGELKQR
jgi:hypothetical protein